MAYQLVDQSVYAQAFSKSESVFDVRDIEDMLNQELDDATEYREEQYSLQAL